MQHNRSTDPDLWRCPRCHQRIRECTCGMREPSLARRLLSLFRWRANTEEEYLTAPGPNPALGDESGACSWRLGYRHAHLALVHLSRRRWSMSARHGARMGHYALNLSPVLLVLFALLLGIVATGAPPAMAQDAPVAVRYWSDGAHGFFTVGSESESGSYYWELYDADTRLPQFGTMTLGAHSAYMFQVDPALCYRLVVYAADSPQVYTTDDAPACKHDPILEPLQPLPRPSLPSMYLPMIAGNRAPMIESASPAEPTPTPMFEPTPGLVDEPPILAPVARSYDLYLPAITDEELR